MNNVEISYENIDSFGFADKSIRQGFIRKLYGILMCQISLTVVIVSVFTFHEGLRAYVNSFSALCVLGFIVVLVALIVLSRYTETRRKAPMNYICLSIFTLAEGFFLGCISSVNNKEEVFYPALVTLVVTVGLTMFAFQTKVDFTECAFLVVVVLILFLFGVACIVNPGQKLNMAQMLLGPYLFSYYIVYDTEWIVEGKHKYSISPEEYVFASLNLFTDIVIHVTLFRRTIYIP